jgi:hypothetical protein
VFQYRSQRVALTVSVLLHMLLFITYRPLARIQLFPAAVQEDQNMVRAPLIFELVETPDDAIQERPEQASLISDKNSRARNEIRPEGLPAGEAYSEGQIQYKIFAGGPEAAQAERALQEMQEPAASGKLEQEEPNETTKDLAMKPFDARQELRKQLSEESEAGGEKSILSIRSPYLDDLDYNQRLAAAEALGGVALNTYAWDFAYYILDMKKKLRENTFPPVAFTRFGMISGETVLTFKVWPDGSATDIEVIGYEGHKTLMETSVDAVKDASPFAPLPDDFPEEYLELRWTFIYFVYR